MKKWANNPGFTIVELLIVVVVIAILAAITIVAYNGIQQRAYNSAMLSSAKQAYTSMLQYISQTGAYPLTTSDTELCLTVDNICSTNLQVDVVSSNTALVAALNQNGGLPKSAPTNTTNRKGVVYYRFPTQVFDSTTDAAYVYYVLKGENQDCLIGQISIDARSTPWATTSSNKYSWTGGGETGCYIYLAR